MIIWNAILTIIIAWNLFATICLLFATKEIIKAIDKMLDALKR